MTDNNSLHRKFGFRSGDFNSPETHLHAHCFGLFPKIVALEKKIKQLSF